MYLSNRDVRSIGFEAGEFIDIDRTSDQEAGVEPLWNAGGGAPEPRLSGAERRDIALRTYAYIANLVDNHNGDRDAVRSVIDDLHRLIAVDIDH
jgi:hypothetical protein